MILYRKKKTSSSRADASVICTGRFSAAGKNTYYATFIVRSRRKRFGRSPLPISWQEYVNGGKVGKKPFSKRWRKKYFTTEPLVLPHIQYVYGDDAPYNVTDEWSYCPEGND